MVQLSSDGRIIANAKVKDEEDLTWERRRHRSLRTWKPWHELMAMCIAQGVPHHRIAEITGRARNTIDVYSNAPRMIEAINKWHQLFVKENMPVLNAAMVKLKGELQSAVKEHIRLAKGANSENVQLSAIRLFYEVLGMKKPDTEIGEQQVVINIDKGVQENLERLGVLSKAAVEVQSEDAGMERLREACGEVGVHAESEERSVGEVEQAVCDAGDGSL